VKETVIGFDQVHVWYQLPLHAPRPRRELDHRLRLTRGGHELIPSIVWKIDESEARRRLRSGGTLWIVFDGDVPAFSCWTFRDRTPIRAARGGWLDLPADTACLEESMTSPSFRGKAVAPAAWTSIADALGEEAALRRLVTTVEEENTASRRAVEKIGFYEIGRAHTYKRRRRTAVEVTSSDLEGDGEFLRRLERAA
jgi:RimJ/RimL family protein N-acetyltransferase